MYTHTHMVIAVAIHADGFRGQLGAEYSNTVISRLLLPEPVSPQPDSPSTAPAQVTGGTISGSCTCTCSHPRTADKHTETTPQDNDGSDQKTGKIKEAVTDVYKSESSQVLETGQQSTESTNGDTERDCQVW